MHEVQVLCQLDKCWAQVLARQHPCPTIPQFDEVTSDAGFGWGVTTWSLVGCLADNLQHKQPVTLAIITKKAGLLH